MPPAGAVSGCVREPRRVRRRRCPFLDRRPRRRRPPAGRPRARAGRPPPMIQGGRPSSARHPARESWKWTVPGASNPGLNATSRGPPGRVLLYLRRGRPDGRAQPDEPTLPGNGRPVEHHMQRGKVTTSTFAPEFNTVTPSSPRACSRLLLSAMVFHGCTCGKGDEPSVATQRRPGSSPGARQRDDPRRPCKGCLSKCPIPACYGAPAAGDQDRVAHQGLAVGAPGHITGTGDDGDALAPRAEDLWLPVGTTGVTTPVAQRLQPDGHGTISATSTPSLPVVRAPVLPCPRRVECHGP